MKGYCKYCGNEVDETEQVNGICAFCMGDRLKYPVLFSELDVKSKNGLLSEICERILALEKTDKRAKKYGLMRDSYIQASNVLEEVHFTVENIQSELHALKGMVNNMKVLFQKGWGVPK